MFVYKKMGNVGDGRSLPTLDEADQIQGDHGTTCKAGPGSASSKVVSGSAGHLASLSI